MLKVQPTVHPGGPDEARSLCQGQEGWQGQHGQRCKPSPGYTQPCIRCVSSLQLLRAQVDHPSGPDAPLTPATAVKPPSRPCLALLCSARLDRWLGFHVHADKG